MANPMSSIREKLAAAAGRFEAANGGYRPKKKREWTRQIIKTTRFDDLDWQEARQDKAISDGIQDLYLGDLKNPDDCPGYLNAPELMRDIYMAYLKPVPMMYKKQEVKKDARLNGKFIEQMMKLPEYERLHDQTMTDPMLSTMATALMVDALREMIKQHREAVKEANERREQDDQEGDDGEPGGSNDSWDEETPGNGKPGKGGGNGKGGGKSPGKSEGKGESQFDPKDEDDDEFEPEEAEPEPDWDANEDPAEGGEGGEGGEGESEEAEGDEDGNTDENEREFDAEAYAEEEYDKDSNWEQMVEGMDLGRIANKALAKAADEIDEMDQARKGVGIEDGEWKMMDPKERLKIAARLNTSRMRAIADMVGRMKRFAMSQQAQKIIDAPHEIFTVEMGNDLRRVLRSEFAFLGTPETSIEFYRRYIEGTLLQYKERGHEDVGKGPIICCIDNSGSMGGAPENWAKGVAEALRRICQEQERDFHAIYFETNRHRERFDFPKGRGPFEKVMAFLGISAGGGTEFDGVLTEALAKCATMFDGEAQGKADIIFITDGEAYLDQKWIDDFVKERDRVGVRIFGVYISAYDSSRSSALKGMEKFCQVVIPVKALEVNDEAAATIFSHV